jgi:hypothetical protein
VSSWYAATLMQRGYTEVVTWGGGEIHSPGLKEFLEWDGCLLLGSEEDLLEIAHHIEVTGKPIWRELAVVR